MEGKPHIPEVAESERKDIKKILQSILYKSLIDGVKKAEDIDYKREVSERFEEELIVDTVLESSPEFRVQETFEPGKVYFQTREQGESTLELFRKEIPVGQVVIKETVVKQKKTDEPNKTKTRGAILKISNKQEGEFCLNDILPYEYSFYPTNKALDQYKGLDKNEVGSTTFSFQTKTGEEHLSKIIYGNITDNKGILSLLHEITHSWQNIYHREAVNDHSDVQKVVDEAIDCAMLTLCKKDLENNEALSHIIVDFLKAKYNAEEKDFYTIVIKELNESKKSLQKRRIIFDNDDNVDTTQAEDLKSKISDYVWTERHAWSTALKMLRELENASLLPEKVDQESLREHIHYCLHSYQIGLNFLGIKGDKDFTAYKPLPESN